MQYKWKMADCNKFRVIQRWNLPKQHVNVNFLEHEITKTKLKRGEGTALNKRVK